MAPGIESTINGIDEMSVEDVVSLEYNEDGDHKSIKAVLADKDEEDGSYQFISKSNREGFLREWIYDQQGRLEETRLVGPSDKEYEISYRILVEEGLVASLQPK